MSEYATFIKVGATVALLEMIEANAVFRDMTLANPIRAIRQISQDPDLPPDRTARQRAGALRARHPVGVPGSGSSVSGGARAFAPAVQKAVEMWEHLLTGREKDPLSLHREVDWVTSTI